jgi:hypothetical protein
MSSNCSERTLLARLNEWSFQLPQCAGFEGSTKSSGVAGDCRPSADTQSCTLVSSSHHATGRMALSGRSRFPDDHRIPTPGPPPTGGFQWDVLSRDDVVLKVIGGKLTRLRSAGFISPALAPP